MNKDDQAGVGPLDGGVGQHSPGPWEWRDDGELYAAETKAVHGGKTCTQCGHNPAHCGPPVFCLASSLEVAEAWESEMESSGIEYQIFQTASAADRAVIVAAPDMLAELRRQLANVARWLSSGSAEPDELREAHEQIKAVSDKAVGVLPAAKPQPPYDEAGWDLEQWDIAVRAYNDAHTGLDAVAQWWKANHSHVPGGRS